ncbi:hypothetical protein RKD19_000212 [Streptomyces canus]
MSSVSSGAYGDRSPFMFHRFAFGRAMPPVPPACEWTTVRAAPCAPRIAEGVESADPVPCVDGRRHRGPCDRTAHVPRRPGAGPAGLTVPRAAPRQRSHETGSTGPS